MSDESAKSGATTRVTILDEPFGIRSEADPDYTRRVAAHVDERLRTLRQSSPALEPFPVAVLGAMEITDDLFRSREGMGTAMRDAVYRVERLVERIDEALETPRVHDANREEEGPEA